MAITRIPARCDKCRKEINLIDFEAPIGGAYSREIYYTMKQVGKTMHPIPKFLCAKCMAELEKTCEPV